MGPGLSSLVSNYFRLDLFTIHLSELPVHLRTRVFEIEWHPSSFGLKKERAANCVVVLPFHFPVLIVIYV